MYIASKADALTDRQNQLVKYLRDYQREHGVMPSTREIQRHFGFASQTAAMSHLRALEKKGVITRHAGKARAVVFPESLNRNEVMDIPVFGAMTSGDDAENDTPTQDCISVDLNTLGVPRTARTFALRVNGDSMIGAHICNGDFVILEVREPRPRDIVAALVEGETVLKRFVLRNGVPYLKAENPLFPDLLPMSELVIQGVMVALIRHQ